MGYRAGIQYSLLGSEKILMVELPEKLKPYTFHGAELRVTGSEQSVGTCPFCGREDHFSVNLESGLWTCHRCGESGNASTFLRKLWTLCDAQTQDYGSLEDRGMLYPDTFMHWGVARSVLTGDWLVPGYNREGKLCQLYRYISDGRRMKLMPTPTLGHQLFGVPLYDSHKPTVYLCEGPWDGMKLWETLRFTKETKSGYMQTANPASSLLAISSVLAVPGCTTFQDSWLPLFEDKTVVLMYDSDHPGTHPKTGKATPPAGSTGMRRVARLLLAAGTPAGMVKYLYWGDAGYNPAFSSGYDVRDRLSKELMTPGGDSA